MKKRLTAICFCTALGLLAAIAVVRAGDATDPVFDFKAILGDPLDAKVLKSAESAPASGTVKTIITEEIEYTGETRDGKPLRIFGILAYPKGGTKLPAIFWSQGGMAPAGPYWPQIWAAKGYLCLNVTLPTGECGAFTRFATEKPEDGNMARLAAIQMRGITYLTRRPEVDPERIGMGGSSYGGFFASLIAGADSRVKAGMSFFTTGHHELGSNFPEFKLLRNAKELVVWSRTVDPAWRLKSRAIPFLWGVAANDGWLHLPGCVKTFEEAMGEKRLAIAPNWSHAFPANFDQALMDWFDIYLAKTRKPYNQPAELRIRTTDGKLMAQWTWTGENPVRKAELVVAYGRTRPWLDGWPYRYHHAIPAAIIANTATAEVPLPKKGLECLLYGNISDDHDVVVSTLPLVVRPEDVKGVLTTTLALNTALMSDFSDEEMVFFQRHGEPVAGTIDRTEKQAGGQSLRLDPAPGKAPPTFEVKLGHIPGHGHRVSLWLKAAQPATVKVSVTGQPPANREYAMVDILRKQQPVAPAIAAADRKPVAYSMDAAADTKWREFQLDCPLTSMPVDGYRLSVSSTNSAAIWIDTIRFEPQWE